MSSALERCCKEFLLQVEKGTPREWSMRDGSGEKWKQCRSDSCCRAGVSPASQPITWLARCLPCLSSANLLLQPPHVARKNQGLRWCHGAQACRGMNSRLCYEKQDGSQTHVQYNQGLESKLVGNGATERLLMRAVPLCRVTGVPGSAVGLVFELQAQERQLSPKLFRGPTYCKTAWLKNQEYVVSTEHVGFRKLSHVL